MPSDRALRSAAFAAILISAFAVPAALAQGVALTVLPAPRWTLTGQLEVVHAGADSWSFGPALGLRRDFGPRWGVELRAALPTFGPSESGAGAIDLAATYTTVTGATEVGASLGGTAFLVGDHSELTGGGVGLYAAAHATRWLSQGFGVTGGADLGPRSAPSLEPLPGWRFVSDPASSVRPTIDGSGQALALDPCGFTSATTPIAMALKCHR